MTGHGFRSVASTLLHEQGWNHQAIERQLAHAERNVVSGTTCDTATRFVDNGDNTVTDNLTALVWEKKTTAPGTGANPSDWHDVDNTYT